MRILHLPGSPSPFVACFSKITSLLLIISLIHISTSAHAAESPLDETEVKSAEDASCKDNISEMVCTLACFANINIALDADGVVELTPEMLLAGDPGCDPSTLTISPATVSCADVGSTITYTVTGPSSSCFGSLLVEDKTGPTIATFSNVNVSLDADGVVEMTEDILVAFVNDNCDSDLTYSFSPASVSCADVGSTITVITTVTDPGGNTNNSFSSVLVEDKSTPTLATFANVNVSLDADGVVEMTEDILVASVSDNCDSDLTYTFSPASVSCADVGSTITVFTTVTDPGGNTNNSFSSVLVEDKLSPVAICEASVIVDLAGASSIVISPSAIDAGSFDNCSAVGLSINPSAFTIADLGTNVVTLTATDASGNTNACWSNVEVINSAYCTSAGLSTSREFIRRVRLAPRTGIRNTSFDNGGYADFTSIVGDVDVGTTYDLFLKPGFNGRKRDEFWQVWIDWNQNNSFDDAGELVAAGTSRRKLTRTVTVPASALTGTTRMRVSMQFGSAVGSCGDFALGEVEDYSINVTNPAARTIIVSEDKPSISLPENNLQDLSPITAFPNPASENIQLASSTALGKSLIQILDIQGKVLYSEWSYLEKNVPVTLPVASFTPGLYFLHVQSDQESLTKTFIKQ